MWAAMTIIAYVASNNTAGSQELARHAEPLAMGATGTIGTHAVMPTLIEAIWPWWTRFLP